MGESDIADGRDVLPEGIDAQLPGLPDDLQSVHLAPHLYVPSQVGKGPVDDPAALCLESLREIPSLFDTYSHHIQEVGTAVDDKAPDGLAVVVEGCGVIYIPRTHTFLGEGHIFHLSKRREPAFQPIGTLCILGL